MNDWSSRIKDLEGRGWSLKGIGEVVGLSTSSISDIKRGATAEPRGMSAVKLHDLHASGRGPESIGPEAGAGLVTGATALKVA